MKKALLIFASLLLAILLQQLLGMGLLWLSELRLLGIPPQLGMLGFLLMPLSPFLAGIYWLPFTTVLVFWAVQKIYCRFKITRQLAR